MSEFLSVILCQQNHGRSAQNLAIFCKSGQQAWNPRWWFQILFIFIPTWGNDLIWLIFFKGCWNHQLESIFKKSDTNLQSMWKKWQNTCTCRYPDTFPFLSVLYHSFSATKSVEKQNMNGQASPFTLRHLWSPHIFHELLLMVQRSG